MSHFCVWSNLTRNDLTKVWEVWEVWEVFIRWICDRFGLFYALCDWIAYIYGTCIRSIIVIDKQVSKRTPDRSVVVELYSSTGKSLHYKILFQRAV